MEIGIDGLGISLKVIVSIPYLQEGRGHIRAFRMGLDETLKFFNGFLELFLPEMGPTDPVLGFISIGALRVRFDESSEMFHRLINEAQLMSGVLYNNDIFGFTGTLVERLGAIYGDNIVSSSMYYQQRSW
jgi:hypothetical protein